MPRAAYRGACALAAGLLAACGGATTRAAPVTRSSQPVETSDVEIDDVMPSFFAWYESVEDAPREEQAARFWAEFAPAHPTIYRRGVISSGYFDPARRDPLTIAAFDVIAERLPRIRALAAALHREVPVRFAAFRERFPDVEWRGPVHLIPSLLSFDGGTRPIEGSIHLLFGVDGIAHYHEEEDMCAFFTHELFHVHHNRYFPEPTTDQRAPLWHGLRAEGLAEHVSEQLCPDATLAEVLLSPTLAEEMEGRSAAVAAELSSVLDTTDEDTYWRYFGAQPDDGLPRRSAYYVGLLIVRAAAGRRPLDELVRLPPEEARRVVVDELGSIAAPR